MNATPHHDIALVISDLSLGGAQRVVTLLADAWTKQGYRVCIINFFDESHDHFKFPAGVSRDVILGTGPTQGFVQGITNNIRRVIRLRSALKKANAPVIISFIGVTNILAVLASVGAPWRLIISERNDPARQSFGRLWDGLRRLTYVYADLVTANSPGAIKTLESFVPSSRLSLVQNPVDLKTFNATIGDRHPVICTAGRLVPQKAYDILLSAFAKCGPALNDWRLLIAGEGPLRATLQQQADELDLGSRVTWLGQVDDCASLFTDASIFALPSRFEGTPNALLEAMASGCAVIVSDASSGPLDYVTDQQNGLVVPVEDVDALARALETLATDVELRARMSAAAQTAVAHNAQELVVAEWGRLAGLESMPQP